MIMIILFSFSLGMMAAKYRKYQIDYADAVLYMGEKILLMLNTTSPETDEIIRRLKDDERLCEIDFDNGFISSPLDKRENTMLKELFEILGKYDIKSQVNYINEFIGFFKLSRQRYEEYYSSHYKLYLVFGLFSGVLVCILLM